MVTHAAVHRQDQERECETRYIYQFVHLTVQEMLAMTELLRKDEKTLMDVAARISKSPSFNMAKMFLYGLRFDKSSTHINHFMESVLEGEESSSEGDDDLVKILARVS